MSRPSSPPPAPSPAASASGPTSPPVPTRTPSVPPVRRQEDDVQLQQDSTADGRDVPDADADADMEKQNGLDGGTEGRKSVPLDAENTGEAADAEKQGAVKPESASGAPLAAGWTMGETQKAEGTFNRLPHARDSPPPLYASLVMASLMLSDIIDIRELIHSVFAFDPTPTPALAPETPPPSSPCGSPTTPASSTADASSPFLLNDVYHRFRVDCAGADGLFLMDWDASIEDDNAQQEQQIATMPSTQAQRVFSKPTTNGTTDNNTSTTAATASTTANGDTAASAPTTNNNNNLPAVLHRPPIRPTVPGVSKSKFDLELNPFEQSFSRSSTSIHPHNNNGKTGTGSSSEDVRGAYDNWNAKQRAASAAAPGGDAATTGTQGEDERRKSDPLHSKMSLSSSSSPGDKTVLPPLSALTSPVPVDPASHFSWAGISSFLRAGPLSPAMLNGPTSTSGNNHHHSHTPHHPPTGLTPGGGFDPNTFRTGFTPGGLGGSTGGVIGSGSGFTPGYAGLLSAGGGFPMPSPNTAAFLSMVTHGTPGPGTPTGGAAAGGRNADMQPLGGGQNGKLASGPSSRSLVNGTVEHGGPGGMEAAGAVNGDVRRTSGDVAADVGGGSIHTMHPGSQQQQHPQVNMTPNSLNVLTGVINRMSSNNTDEDGMYSTTATRPQNSLAHQSSHGSAAGQADSNTAHQLPPPPPHPEHPMHNATDYFVNATGVQPASIGANNNGGVPSHMHPAHPGLAGHLQSHTISSSHLNHHQRQQQHQQQPMSLPPAHLHASSTDPRGGYSMHHPGGATMANVNPQGAVGGTGVGPGGPLNGLFLLSQAHQELGKREEAQRVAGGASVDGLGSDATIRPRVTSTGTSTGRGNKRKSEDGGKQGAGGRSGGTKRSKKSSIGTMHDQQQQNGINVPAYHGQSILQQSQALLAQGLQAQAERDAMQEPADDDEDQKMNDHGKDGGDGDGMGKKDGKPETEEEKRKNFLERNRQAALKCRQRKKAWLTQLQTKVDGLTEENDRLKAMLTSITDEAQKLSAVLSSHRDCPGMAASMAQLGLTLPQMPMPPPHPGVGVGGMPVGHMVQQRQMSVVPPFVPPQPH